MPRRLQLAAEIVKDVAEAVPGADRAVLWAAIADLQRWAEAMAESHRVKLDSHSQMDQLRPSIRRLAAAFAPQAERSADHSTH